VIDGNGAITRTELNYWSEVKGFIKIGSFSIPNNEKASFIIIENLEIRSAHPDYSFTNDDGNEEAYNKNASSIFIENHITMRNCILHNSGNGLFSAHETSDLLIEKNHIYGNGIVGSVYEHNSYTETINIELENMNMGKGKIYDLNGKMMLTFTMFPTNIIDVSTLQKNIFFVEISTMEGIKITKIIKE
jgi:hypothetical protein